MSTTPHYRSELRIVPYPDGENPGKGQFKVMGVIGVSNEGLQDTSDPEVRAELLELAAEGIKALAENKEAITKSIEKDNDE